MHTLLEFFELQVRKRLSPIEFEFVSFPVLVKLIECLGESFADILDGAEMREHKIAICKFPLLGRILIDLNKQTTRIAAQKAKIKFLRIAVPIQYVLIFARIRIQ